jgi:beta-lactamase family protein
MTKLCACAVLALFASTAAAQSSTDLTGLWQATLRWGPDVRGPLLIYRTPAGWVAELAGFKVPARKAGRAFAFRLPGGNGELRDGFWISELNFATPVRLTAAGPNRWRAEIDPVDDRAEVFLPVTRQPDGTLRTYIRELRRNFGFFLRAQRLAVNGSDARLVGSILRGPDTVTLSQGRYEAGTLSLPMRGVTFDFTRVTDTANSAFYPRGNPPVRYHYTPPVQLDDGWPVGTLAAVGISRDSIERFVQAMIDLPMDSLSTLQLHSLLIARHGRLVLEEYFHGNSRDQPHDTRSASKSWMAVLLGAAMQAGVPIRTNTPVYQTMGVDTDDPRKRAMTLEHLITMTAGFNCDPDDSTSADEDQMNQRGIEDWYHYTMNVPLVSAPGEKIFYCSTEPNLAGGMLAICGTRSNTIITAAKSARSLPAATTARAG